jgi:hypothetical protein
MTDTRTLAHPATGTPQRARPTGWLLIGAALVAFLVVSLIVMRVGVENDPRLANPNPGARPYGKFLGVGNWPLVMSLAFPVVLGLYAVWLVRRCRRLGALDPMVLVLAVVCSMAATDPLGNWVTFTVFDPRFPHFPTSWLYVRLAPLVEPVPNFLGGYPFFYLSMALVILWAYQRFVLPRAKPGGFIRRHPMWSMFLVGFVACIPLDTLGQLLFMTQRFYVYTQGWGPSFHLQGFTFPILWGFYDWVLVGLTVSMMHRNDRGQSAVLVALAEKLPSRDRTGDRRSVGRQVLAGALVANVCALALCGVYGLVRVGGLTHPTYEQFPYPQAKVYDPYGDLEKAGKPGPFYR